MRDETKPYTLPNSYGTRLDALGVPYDPVAGLDDMITASLTPEQARELAELVKPRAGDSGPTQQPAGDLEAQLKAAEAAGGAGEKGVEAGAGTPPIERRRFSLTDEPKLPTKPVVRRERF
jgi:hypothetical protein